MITEELVKVYIAKAKEEIMEQVKKELLEELGELITSKYAELEEKITEKAGASNLDDDDNVDDADNFFN